MGESIAKLNIEMRASADKIASDISRDLNAAQSAVASSAGKVGQTISDGIAKQMGGMNSIITAKAVAVGTLIADGIKSGLSSLKNFIGDEIGKSMDLASSFEQDSIAFKVLLGDAQKASAMLEDFRKLDQNSPLNFDDLTSAGKTMLAFGADAQSVVGDLHMLGDISLGNSERFKALGLAFSQIQSTGRLMGQDLLQLVSAGFNPLQQISEKTGESMADLKKKMEGGGISFADVRSAMVDATSAGGRFFGAMEAGADSYQGRMAKLDGALNQFRKSIGEGLNQALKPIVSDLGPALDLAAPKMQSIGTLIGVMGTNAYQAMGGIGGIADGMQTVARWANVVLVAFQGVGKTAASVGEIILRSFRVAFDSVKTGIEAMKVGFKTVAGTVADAFARAFNLVKNSILKMINDIQVETNNVMLGARKLIPFSDTAGLDASIASNKAAGAAYKPQSTVADLPTGREPGSPLAALFPNPKDMIVVYTGVETQVKQLSETTKKAFDDITVSSVDMTRALGEATSANTWGKDLTANIEASRKAAADSAATAVTTAQATAAKTIEIEQNAAVQKVAITKAAATEKVAVEDDAANRIADANKRTTEQFQSTNREAVTDIVTAWATGTGKISDIVNQWANSLIKQFVSLALFGNGGNVAGLASMLGPAIGGMFGGAHADGGRPAMGKISLVGERGPELFVPDSAGRIIPNHRAASFVGAGGQGGGGGGSMEPPMIFNFHQSFMDGVSHAQLAGALDQVQDASKSGVLEAVRRGGGYRRGIQG